MPEITHINREAPRNTSSFPVVRTAVNNGTQQIHVNHQVLPPIAYMSYFGTPHLYRQVSQTGIHLYCFPLILGDRGVNTFSGIGPFRPCVWTAEDTLDMTTPLNDGRMILDADPDGWLIARINLDVPTWWENVHPEGCCQLSDGTTLRQSFYSNVWLNAAERVLRKVLAELASSELAARLAGIHLAAGRTSEWFYHFLPERGFEDENPERVIGFRAWLRQRYSTEELLRKAWREPSAAFDEVVPADIRGIERTNAWISSGEEQAVVDSLRFHSETMADCIARLCRVVKDATDRRLLTGAFYGYHVFLNDARWGHGALDRLLKCPDLDGLASPNDYRRVPGEDWPPMAAVDSVRMHGKLWFAENDTRTHRTTLLKDVAPHICPAGKYEDGVWLGPNDPWIAEQLLWKNAARMLACGYGGWWFDMWGGWFDDQSLLKVLTRHRELASLPLLDPPQMRAQICVVIDETANFRDRSQGQMAQKIFRHRYAMARIGSPCAVILSSDMVELEPESYRCIWMLGARPNTAKLAREAEHLCGAPGKVMITDEFGTRSADGNTTLSLDAELSETIDAMRSMAKAAGVHVYLETSDILYVGLGWLGVHAAEAGEKVIRLPVGVQVKDVIHDRYVADVAAEIRLNLKQHETALFRVEPQSNSPVRRSRRSGPTRD